MQHRVGDLRIADEVEQNDSLGCFLLVLKFRQNWLCLKNTLGLGQMVIPRTKLPSQLFILLAGQ